MLLRIVVISLILAAALGAQSSAGGGSISGVVKDPTGAVIAGAKV
jgi:hypothetical protein